MRFFSIALAGLIALIACGCAPPVKPPDTVQIQRGVDRSNAVQAETDKRVKEYDDLTAQKR
ncbi:MAG: hypothetical protein QM758_07420 [Armatimonas sp.]